MKGWNILTQKNPLIEITGLGLFLEAFGVKKMYLQWANFTVLSW